MIRTSLLAAAAALFLAGAAWANPIEGDWRTESGATARIAPCGEAYCITLKSGDHAGKQIGRMQAGEDGAYSGEITDPANDKTYKGKGSLSGNTLEMSGCVLGGLICRSQTWNRL